MRKQNFGRLIGFSSSSGLTGNAGQANYSAAKAGIAGMTRCLAIDLGRNGITAKAIAIISINTARAVAVIYNILKSYIYIYILFIAYKR